jgi:hypothetical protein
MTICTRCSTWNPALMTHLKLLDLMIYLHYLTLAFLMTHLHQMFCWTTSLDDLYSNTIQMFYLTTSAWSICTQIPTWSASWWSVCYSLGTLSVLLMIHLYQMFLLGISVLSWHDLFLTHFWNPVPLWWPFKITWIWHSSLDDLFAIVMFLLGSRTSWWSIYHLILHFLMFHLLTTWI